MDKKGFTLIELLVVIAIIGILSSVAIVYLQDARNKANDAKVQSNIATASTQSEIARANGTVIDAAYAAAIVAKLGGHPCGGSWAFAPAAPDSVIVWSAKLCTDGAVYFCADTAGFRGTSTQPAADAVACPH